MAQDYDQYLQSEHWQQTRKAALAAAEYRCQVCNDSKRLRVHHRTYERLGQERPADLTVLCDKCHGIFHDHGKLKGPRHDKSRPEIGRAHRTRRLQRKRVFS